MIPQQGQHIRCIISTKCSTLEIEGIVESWNDEVILKLLDNKKIVIIHDVSNIVLTEILLEDEKSNIEQQIIPIKTQIKEKLKEIQISSSNDIEAEQKSISDLKKLAAQQEKETLEKMKKEHFGTPYAPKTTYYNSQLSILPKRK